MIEQPDKITTVIVDDEPDARDMLELLLKDFPQILVAAKADSVSTGVEAIIDHKPALLFLDVEMPGKTGFDLINEIKEFNHVPAVIFTTAYDKYAIEALRHAAFDFLLKPVKTAELKRSIHRYESKATEEVSLRERYRRLWQDDRQSSRIRFRTMTGVYFYDPADILYCQADGNYTEVFFAGGNRELVTAYLSSVEEMLPAGKFCRISRSVLINMDFLYHINRKKRTCEIRRQGEVISFAVPTKNLKKIEQFFETGR